MTLLRRFALCFSLWGVITSLKHAFWLYWSRYCIPWCCSSGVHRSMGAWLCIRLRKNSEMRPYGHVFATSTIVRSSVSCISHWFRSHAVFAFVSNQSVGVWNFCICDWHIGFYVSSVARCNGTRGFWDGYPQTQYYYSITYPRYRASSKREKEKLKGREGLP